VAQPVPTRDAPKAGWSFPRPKLRINLTVTGIVLALAAWMLQSYFATAAAARSELDRSLQFAKLQREMWLIEYNSSLIRAPRNERVTARAAFHVVEDTYALLAWSDAAGQFSPSRRSETLQQARDNTAKAKKLFDDRDYASLVGELNAVSQLYENRMQEAPIVTGSQHAGLAWWQHLFPALFLVGIVLCVLDRRARGRIAGHEI
jgi:hypothetical protein